MAFKILAFFISYCFGTKNRIFGTYTEPSLQFNLYSVHIVMMIICFLGNILLKIPFAKCTKTNTSIAIINMKMFLLFTNTSWIHFMQLSESKHYCTPHLINNNYSLARTGGKYGIFLTTDSIENVLSALELLFTQFIKWVNI